VDGQGTSDLRAVDELVGSIDDALGGAVEGCECVGEEIEVAFVTFGTLVDDLHRLARNGMIRKLENEAYHSRDRLSAVRNLHTATTVGSCVPSLATESCAVKAGGQGVGGERAGAALHIATIESRLARDGAASDEVFIGALSRDSSSKSRAEQRKERKSGLEVHGDDA